jgi:Meckel syndrome type 1 protein
MDDDPFLPPAAAAPFPTMLPSEPSDGLGLALEDRLTPPPMKVVPVPGAEPALDLGGFGEAPAFEAALGASRDPFAAAGMPYDPGSFEYASGPIEDAPALGNHASAAAPAFQDAAPSRASPAFAEGLKPSAAAAAARVASRATDERIPRRRSSRLRAVAVNAVALAVLLLVALAILALWRTEGPIEAGSLRPSALLAALRGGGAAPDPFGAHDVSSGVYERQRGAPLLFVSGKVVSRAPAPVAAVKVSVEVVRAGQVLARGEAIAGAVPTPEELYAAADDAALARAAKAARRRAPAAVKPGDAVPFLVAIGDAPPDLEGAAIRLDVAAAGGSP